jgi:Arc/MetJ-type ribon-helix-helix transcriptional regulator
MAPKRIMLTVTRQLDEFLERMVEETGIDRSNLIRMRLWNWMQEERDRVLAERQLSLDVTKRKSPRP